MKIFECLQGSPEWHEVRKGRITASQMHRVLTPARAELAAGRFSYAFELAIERLLPNEPKPPLDGLYWLERGRLLEPDAVKHYEFVHSCRTATVGFITTDDGKLGCSPDRIMVDEIGGLELKAPSPEKHLDYFIRGPGNDYRCQVQGSMLITGFPWWDFMSYSPQLPDALYRFERDEPFITKLKAALDQFSDELDAIVEKVRAAGFVEMPGQITASQATDGWQRMLAADPEGLWAIG